MGPDLTVSHSGMKLFSLTLMNEFRKPRFEVYNFLICDHRSYWDFFYYVQCFLSDLS